MPRHAETRRLPWSPEQLFGIVADVGRYPEFLPWVIGTRITSRSETLLVADLIVGFKMVRERFTSRVTLDRPGHIHVDYVAGPLRYLRNDWRFRPAPGGGTDLDFAVDFEFSSKLFERLAGLFFDEALRRMVRAFEKRAGDIYGVPGADLPKLAGDSVQPAARPDKSGILGYRQGSPPGFGEAAMQWIGRKRVAFVPVFRSRNQPPDIVPPDFAQQILKKVLFNPIPQRGGADFSLRGWLRAASSGRADIDPTIMAMQTSDALDTLPADFEPALGAQLRRPGFRSRRDRFAERQRRQQCRLLVALPAQ